MKYIYLILIFISSTIAAQPLWRHQAPYEGVNSQFGSAVLNGQINQLMPSFCVFWSVGQGGICEAYYQNIIRNFNTEGGSPERAYCENMQQALSNPPVCEITWRGSQCDQNTESYRMQIQEEKYQLQENFDRYCSN